MDSNTFSCNGRLLTRKANFGSYLSSAPWQVHYSPRRLTRKWLRTRKNAFCCFYYSSFELFFLLCPAVSFPRRLRHFVVAQVWWITLAFTFSRSSRRSSGPYSINFWAFGSFQVIPYVEPSVDQVHCYSLSSRPATCTNFLRFNLYMRMRFGRTNYSHVMRNIFPGRLSSFQDNRSIKICRAVFLSAFLKICSTWHI